MASLVAMLLLVLPILRRKSSKSRRKVKSNSFIRILRERYCNNRERKDLCFDAEPYLPKLSRRVMVESKHSPIVQFTLRPLVSRRLSRVTSISNASSFLIRRYSSETLLYICSYSSWLSGRFDLTLCFFSVPTVNRNSNACCNKTRFAIVGNTDVNGAVLSFLTLSLRRIGSMLILIAVIDLRKQINSLNGYNNRYNILAEIAIFRSENTLYSIGINKKISDNLLIIRDFFRDPAGARTRDPNIKSVVLYRLSYRINACQDEITLDFGGANVCIIFGINKFLPNIL